MEGKTQFSSISLLSTNLLLQQSNIGKKIKRLTQLTTNTLSMETSTKLHSKEPGEQKLHLVSYSLAQTAWAMVKSTLIQERCGVGLEEQWMVCKCPVTAADSFSRGIQQEEWAAEEQVAFAQQTNKTDKTDFSKEDGVAGAWLCLGQQRWAGWDGGLQSPWHDKGVREIERLRKT